MAMVANVWQGQEVQNLNATFQGRFMIISGTCTYLQYVCKHSAKFKTSATENCGRGWLHKIG